MTEAMRIPDADTTGGEFVERATAAFRQSLVALLESSGIPEDEPESLGERAGLAAAATAVWTEEVGPFLDTDGVRRILGGVTKQAVSERVRSGRLLALRTGSGRLVYPLWQFLEGELLPGLPEVLGTAGYEAQRPSTGWTIASWLATEDPDLGNETPRELLAAGRLEPVLAAARDVRVELGTDELGVV